MNERKIPGVKKIAILRANALGDFIFSLPAIYAVRKAYPNAQIVLLGKKWHKDFLLQRKSPIDNVYIVPPAKGVSESDRFERENKKDTEKFFHLMKEENFDIGIQLHGGGTFSNPFINNIGAKVTVGLRTPNAEKLQRYIPYIYYQNEILRLLEVVSLIGATTKNIYPKIHATKKDQYEAEKMILKKPFIVLHPGATDLKRQWDPEKFAAVGDYFFKKGFDIVVTGTGNEEHLVDTVLKTMKHEAYNMCGKLRLSGLVGLLSLAELVISNDTGPLHLATALGTKTVGLYWCGNLINGDPMQREIHRPILSWIIHCPLCNADCASVYPFKKNKSTCMHNVSFVNNITIDEVIQEACSLISL